jgi:hypothetical protein
MPELLETGSGGYLQKEQITYTPLPRTERTTRNPSRTDVGGRSDPGCFDCTVSSITSPKIKIPTQVNI